MSVQTLDYLSSGSDTGRGPSLSLWGSCPITDILEDPSKGMHFFDDFLVAGQPALNAASSMGQWACFADTASTITDAAQEGGVVKLLNTANPKQIILASNTGSFQFCTAATGYPLKGKMWFECRVAVGSITTAIRDFFIGLCDNTTSQICSANNLVVSTSTNTLVTTPNLFGFHFRATTNPTDVGLAFNVAGGTVQYPTNLQTLSLTVAGAALTAFAAVTNGNATGFVKLGFVFDPTGGNPPKIISSASSGQTAGNVAKPLITIYVNGQPAAAFLTSTNVQAATFPVGFMSPVIAFGTQTNSGAGYIDWIRVAQVASF